MAMQDAEADPLARKPREVLQMRKGFQPDQVGVEQTRRELQHRIARHDAAVAGVLRQVTLANEGLDQTVCGWPGDTGPDCDLRDRQRTFGGCESVENIERLFECFYRRKVCFVALRDTHDS